MRGNVYRPGARRTGSILLTVGAGLALVVAVILASASTALAKGHTVHVRPPVAIVASHAPAARRPPAVIARAAGHKIA